MREDQTFHNLEQWIINHGIAETRAALARERIADFCKETGRSFGNQISFGLTAKVGEYGGTHVWLSLLWPESLSLDSPEQSRRMNVLAGIFTRNVDMDISPRPSIHLEFVPPNELPLASFEESLRTNSSRIRAEFLGIVVTERGRLVDSVPQ